MRDQSIMSTVRSAAKVDARHLHGHWALLDNASHPSHGLFTLLTGTGASVPPPSPPPAASQTALFLRQSKHSTQCCLPTPTWTNQTCRNIPPSSSHQCTPALVNPAMGQVVLSASFFTRYRNYTSPNSSELFRQLFALISIQIKYCCFSG